MKIELIKLQEIIPYINNPKEHPDEQIKQIMDSIAEFGFNDPVAIDENNVIIEGHGRLLAAQRLKINEIPCIKLSHLSEAQKKAYIIAHNKITLNSGFNLEKLHLEFKRLEELNFDLNLTGFDPDEIDNCFPEMKEGLTDDDSVPEIPKGKSICKIGDLWRLGNHRLLCGDALKLENISKLMNSEKADIIFNDPPYNIGFDFQKGFSDNEIYSPNKIVNDHKSEKDYKEFINTSIKNCLKYTKKNAHIFYWCDQRYIWLIQKLYRENKIKSLRVCLWLKNSFTPIIQTAFHKCYEPCCYATIGSPKLNKNARNITEILNYDIIGKGLYDQLLSMLDIWINKRDNQNKYIHPTQKPVELFLKPFKRCSNRNDIILDVFGGSGTTIIACEKMDRRCRMIEIDTYYCDVIIKRWEGYTDKKATKL